MLDAWSLDPAIVYLNHGTVGATPRRVLEAQQAIRDEVERQPAKALFREFTGQLGAVPQSPSRLRAAAAIVGDFVGARGEDLAFVDNATTGANAVIGSLDLAPGDEILVNDHTYGAVTNAAAYHARRRGASVRVALLPYPVTSPAGCVAAIEAALGPRTRLAIVDHVTSTSALVLPVADIVARCHRRGVPVLVDGAHAPGAIALQVAALGADWYTANLHKWAWTPRSCGFIWTTPARQGDLHPTVISWGLDQGFAQEFDCVGTKDLSMALSAPTAIAYMRELGEDAVRAYNHGLALEAARFLARTWGTELVQPEAMTGTMVSLPLPPALGDTYVDATRVRDSLLFDSAIEAQIHPGPGGLWLRISAQIYNDMSDIERLERAIAAMRTAVR